ncbi:hypothetical protein [Caudoviricetes sp.]|nr:hypothetical protein [Caudoviricetes sp.]UOF79660.1 hypothetical protein [Caudoviricetes sp.]UOF79865.1 hypothetical protein [Bacteriophage sp.]UOF81331.1 hypothetical protein [Caudoviricetes sp.]
MISFKPTVRFDTNPENLAMLHAVCQAYQELGLHATITSANDSMSSLRVPNTRHALNWAFDVSVSGVPEHLIHACVNGIQRRLGGDYQTIFEAKLDNKSVTIRWPHIHVEFDPH